MDADARLIRIASAQYSVFTTAQAVAAGLSKRAINRRVDAGLLRRLHRGVLIHASSPVAWQQRVMAACLACGPRVAASFDSAAVIWGLANDLDVPHVTVPHSTNRTRSGVVIHKSSHFEKMTRRGFPVTPPMRTILDLAQTYPEERLEIALDDALRAGYLELTRLAQYLDREEHLGRVGSGVLREMVGARTPGRPIGSALETILFSALRKVGLPLPVTQHPVETRDGMRYIDLAYPEAHLAIELDGFERHGRSRAVFDDDRIRQNELMELGWGMRRFSATPTRRDPIGAAIAVGRALGMIPARWRRA